MDDFKIEKGVPLETTAKADHQFPWDQMEIGDSFLYPSSVQGALRAQVVTRRAKGEQHKTRRVDAKNRRVWRTK